MTGYVDRIVLGENHIYQYPTSNEVYKSGPFDPEGLLGKYIRNSTIYFLLLNSLGN